MRRRGDREKTWPCNQSTQNLSKLDLDGLDSLQPFGGRPTGRRPVVLRVAGVDPVAVRVLGRPTGRFAAAVPAAAFGGLPTGRFAGVVVATGVTEAGAIAARMVRSVSSRRSASARTRRRAARVAVSASASETGAPPSRFFLSSHDRSDPTIDCDGASDACGAPTHGPARARPGSTVHSHRPRLGSRSARSSWTRGR